MKVACFLHAPNVTFIERKLASQENTKSIGSRTNTDTAYYCGFQGLADIYQFLYSYIVLVFFIFLSIFNSTPSLESHC